MTYYIGSEWLLLRVCPVYQLGTLIKTIALYEECSSLVERSGVSVGHSRDRLLPKFGKRDVMNEMTPYGWSVAGPNPVVLLNWLFPISDKPQPMQTCGITKRNKPHSIPPQLSWQSVRLLTEMSQVRALQGEPCGIEQRQLATLIRLRSWVQIPFPLPGENVRYHFKVTPQTVKEV